MATLVDLAGLQLDALPAQPIDAGPDEGMEESAAALDLGASLARAERHADAIHRLGAVFAPPSPDDRAAYGTYVAQCVDALRLPNISGREVVAVHARQTRTGVKNRLPKPWGLYRLLALLVYDQKVRDHLGVPLRFNSIHRDGPYNAAIGGASKSAHRACTARDRVAVGSSPRALAEVEASLRRVHVELTTGQARVLAAVAADYGLGPAFTESVFGEPFSRRGLGFTAEADRASYTYVGGIGRYATFVHGDARGVAATWRG
ncbi:MAG: hypothetical protein CMM84_16195 [Rhodothermaceae bacterium]|nr:hypothetical protein [Rhodothermaceae bacterium]MBC12514.1 hypothetical protein [Rhodothermaceae bacterium]